MRRRDEDDRFRGRDRRPDNNFDNMYDAREYDGDRFRDEKYRDYDDRDMRRDRDRRDIRRGTFGDRDAGRGRYDEYEVEPAPRKRSFFSRGAQRTSGARDHIEQVPSPEMGANQLVVMTPKSFDDIKGIIDNLKRHRALIIDLCRLNDNSVQRVMDYINGAIYAIDGSIQRINPAVFLLAPTGMAISVPMDFIKDKWEKNRKK